MRIEKDFYTVVKTSQIPREDVWVRLAQQSRGSFFLSWSWLHSWIAMHVRMPIVLSVYTPCAQLVGCCIFNTATRYRFGLPVRQLRLHQTGLADQDIICLEYNDVLCMPGHENQVRHAVAKYLFQDSALAFDEVVLSGVTRDVAKSWHEAVHFQASLYVVSEAGSAYVDLRALNRGHDPKEAYLATLGKSTRANIRRSFRLYEDIGAVRLEVAHDSTQAWQMLEMAQPLHKQRWGRAALEYPGYAAFHRHLIEHGFAEGVVDVLCVRCGEKPIGWLYNFIYEGRVYYYFGAFDFDPKQPKLKPGLVTHTLAIAYYVQKGMHVYDFMAGDLRYKRNLGTPGPDILTIALQKSTPTIALERCCRKVKRKLQSLRILERYLF